LQIVVKYQHQELKYVNEEAGLLIGLYSLGSRLSFWLDFEAYFTAAYRLQGSNEAQISRASYLRTGIITPAQPQQPW
jgi:hypothetical protein